VEYILLFEQFIADETHSKHYSFSEVQAIQQEGRIMKKDKSFIFYDADKDDIFTYEIIPIEIIKYGKDKEKAYGSLCISKYKNNGQQEDAEAVSTLLKILKEQGHLNPIVVTEDLCIMDGHHRYAAYCEASKNNIRAYNIPAFVRQRAPHQ